MRRYWWNNLNLKQRSEKSLKIVLWIIENYIVEIKHWYEIVINYNLNFLIDICKKSRIKAY